MSVNSTTRDNAERIEDIIDALEMRSAVKSGLGDERQATDYQSLADRLLSALDAERLRADEAVNREMQYQREKTEVCHQRDHLQNELDAERLRVAEAEQRIIALEHGL